MRIEAFEVGMQRAARDDLGPVPLTSNTGDRRKAYRTVGLPGEHALRHQGMEVDVRIER